MPVVDAERFNAMHTPLDYKNSSATHWLYQSF